MAEWIAGLAEEVHKLVTHRRERVFTTPAQRAILALRLAFPLALHFRLVYPTENVIWDLVSDRMGEHWRELQGAAFAGSDEAALEMYRLVACQVRDLLSPEEAAVVQHACALGGHPV